MALKDLLDMTEVNRYTQDGRDKINALQDKVTEDVTYKIGDISQKTGLQKTANGWVKPKGGQGKQSAKPEAKGVPKQKKENPAEKMNLSEGQQAILQQQKEKAGQPRNPDFDLSKAGYGEKKTWQEKQTEKLQKKMQEKGGVPYGRGFSGFPLTRTGPSKKEKQDAVYKELGLTEGDFEKMGDDELDKLYQMTQRSPAEKQAAYNNSKTGQAMNKAREEFAAEQKRRQEAAAKTNAIGLPKKPAESKPAAESKLTKGDAEEQSKPKTYTSKEGRRNFRAALEDNPKDAYDFSKTVEHSIPMSAGDKEQLANIKSFMQDENTDYKDAIKSVATGLVNGNQMRGDWYPEKEQSVLKIAKSVGLEKELMNYIKANHKGYEFGYSEDAAPKIRELTGDCKIRIRR